LAKAALIRVQQCEDAIWTLLCIPEVKQALQNTLHSGGQVIIEMGPAYQPGDGYKVRSDARLGSTGEA